MLRTHVWKQSGKVSLWRYTDNEGSYPVWHVTADAAGCQSLVCLLDAFAADGIAASRVIAITPPSKADLAVPGRSAAWRAPDKLRIAFTDSPAHWSFPLDLDPAVLTIGLDWLAPLRDGIAGIPHGRGDHCVGPFGRRIARLCFWW
jgi:hypothetical protein